MTKSSNADTRAEANVPPGPAVTISQEDAIVFSKLLPLASNPSKFERVAGMIAYAQYALHKHQFIEQYSKEEGKPPPEEHLRSIILTFKDENGAALETLKEKSKNLLKEYAVEYAGSVEHTKIVQPIENRIDRRTRFWPSVGASVTGALLYSLLVAAVIFTATAGMPEAKFSKIIRILAESNSELVNAKADADAEGVRAR